MNDRRLEKFAESTAQFLEPGEQVRAGVYSFEGSRVLLFLGIIGNLMLKPHVVLLTDRNVYLLKGGRMSAYKPTAVIAKYPVGSVKVEAGSSFPVAPLQVGDKHLWVGKIYNKDAQALASMASGPSMQG